MSNLQVEIVLVAVFVVVLLGCTALLQRKPRKLNLEHFEEKWKEAQKLCADKSTWPLAIINGDKLLDEALKKRRYKGKTMGERLVAAQHTIKDNDGVWFAHKLRNRLVHEDDTKLGKRDVKEALLGFRHALKDIGALK